MRKIYKNIKFDRGSFIGYVLGPDSNVLNIDVFHVDGYGVWGNRIDFDKFTHWSKLPKEIK